MAYPRAKDVKHRLNSPIIPSMVNIGSALLSVRFHEGFYSNRRVTVPPGRANRPPYMVAVFIIARNACFNNTNPFQEIRPAEASRYISYSVRRFCMYGLIAPNQFRWSLLLEIRTTAQPIASIEPRI